NVTSGTAIGWNATATTGTAIGPNTNAGACIAIGSGTTATQGIAIGTNATCTHANATIVSPSGFSRFDNEYGIGYAAYSTNANGMQRIISGTANTGSGTATRTILSLEVPDHSLWLIDVTIVAR